MVSPTVTNDGLDAKIAWIALSFNSGTLTKYVIKIKNSIGDYVEDLTVCDGTNTII